MKARILDILDIDSKTLQKIASKIKNGAVAVIPTDTIYGIVGAAKNPQTVEKIYKLRKRNIKKPMIVLISAIGEISELGVALSKKQKEMLGEIWPNPVSVVIDSPNPKLEYLHRGKNSLAFRLPKNEFLLKILKTSGPIVAPSANPEGEKPARNIEEAGNYFGDSVDIYIDGGQLNSLPSTVVKLNNLGLTVLREGAAKIPQELLK